MRDIVDLAAGFRHVGRDPPAVERALQSLRTEKRFTVDAAYAYARQREADPGWKRAADLLELAVAERNPRVYARPPWWAQLEVWLAGWVLFGMALATVHFAIGGTTAVRYPGTWVWVLYPGIWWYVARRNPDPMRALLGGMGAIDRAVAKTLRTGQALAREGPDVDTLAAAMQEAADGTSEDALQKRMSAAVLARAQRQVASFPERHRRLLLAALDRARHDQAAQTSTR